MPVMFAAGVASLLWMAALTALMAYEKVGYAVAVRSRSRASPCWPG